ncbi:iron ABC transporter permease [Shewanella sp. NFH-SH190041]|uniref:ABC transporter permease n=1 Tax=Shewanella sp. NFH-SH190041 TaxID=2950245 RepID=UPI0021C2C43B|nr:iron ABC transporter permease [Shewanella sp. NFH-SH190041]BDM63485.1 iron ABC transporter permease [Shewanella sp. NFH-SH190041]
MIPALPRRWSLLSFGLALLLLLPAFALLGQALLGQAELGRDNVFAHLLATVLPSYIANTLLLMLLVCIGALLLAIPAAWLVARCDFPGRGLFQWGLLLPLAMPGYLVAYVYTDMLDYAGPVQQWLRAMFHWQSADDYVFPSVRSLGGAAFMLALVLFPYIYLLGRTAFMEQSLNLLQATRVMGCRPWQSFWRFSLPMARPALAVGVALVAMETAADFATVSYFAVPTLTTAVYDTWLEYGSLTAAARLSLIMLLVIFVLIGSERYARRRQQLFQKPAATPLPRYMLQGHLALLASGYCALLLLLAFGLPFMALLRYVWLYWGETQMMQFFHYGLNSLLLALGVSVLCIVMALALLFIRRVSPRVEDQLPVQLAATGYALPGTVLAIGVLVPLTLTDFAVNDLADWLDVRGPGLVLSGSILALIFAFCVRFSAIAIGSVESSYRRIAPSLDMAALTLGLRPAALFFQVHLPLLWRGIFAGMLLVFIEAMKELPAALLLRPVGYENLATYVYQFVSDEQLELGAVAAVVIVLLGLVPLVYLNHSLERSEHS